MWAKLDDMTSFRRCIDVGVCVLIILAIVALESHSLSFWLVDDAAISLAYAKNLASNGVLTHQMGSLPVEGFSNPLWVFLLSLGQFIFQDEALLKYFSVSAYALAILRLATAFINSAALRYPCMIAAVLLAMQPSVAIWSLSGLENPLYLLLGIELFICCLCVVIGKTHLQIIIYKAGFASALMSITRPEGVLYSVPFVMTYVLTERNLIKLKDLFPYFIIVLTVFLSYLAFRLYYFDSIVPNTYLAKGGPSFSALYEILCLSPYIVSKFMRLSQSVFGWDFQTWGLVFFLFVLYRSFRLSGNNKEVVTGSIFLAIGLIIYLALPADWMPENRFATLYYVPFYFLFVHSILSISSRRFFSYAAIIIFTVFSAFQCQTRISQFRDNPTISIDEVKERGIIFERWAKLLDINRPTILIADIGGILLRDKMVVADLGMLCNKEIAEDLGEGSNKKDMAQFHNYIFNKIKPAFISTRAYHSWIASLDSDPRFRRDYIPIKEYIDLWVLKRFEEMRWSGDYIRRDLVEGRAGQFDVVIKEAATMYYPFCKECASAR